MGSDGHMCNGFCMDLIKQMNPGEILGSDGHMCNGFCIAFTQKSTLERSCALTDNVQWILYWFIIKNMLNRARL